MLNCKLPLPIYGVFSDVKQRRWKYVSSRQRREVSKGEALVNFKVASYNVLAQNLLEDHKSLYVHCAAEYLNWEYRKRNLLVEIKQHLPDVSFHFFFMFRQKLAVIYLIVIAGFMSSRGAY